MLFCFFIAFYGDFVMLSLYFSFYYYEKDENSDP